MLLLLLRTVVIYAFILIIMRFMGKRQLGELQASELVTTMIISNLASISIEEQNVPVLTSLMPVIIIASLEIIISAITVKKKKIEELIEGEPKIIIQNGEIVQENLKLLRFTVEEILASLREKDIFDPTTVALAMIESNGKMTAYAVSEPPKRVETIPPMPVIVDGVICEERLKACGKTSDWLKTYLLAQDINTENLLFMLLYNDEKTVVVKKATD